MHPGRWKPSCFPGNLPYSRRNICCRISSLRRDLGTPPDARDRTSKQAETLRFRPRSTPFGGCADGVLAAHFPSRSSAYFRVRIRPNAFARFVTGRLVEAVGRHAPPFFSPRVETAFLNGTRPDRCLFREARTDRRRLVGEPYFERHSSRHSEVFFAPFARSSKGFEVAPARLLSYLTSSDGSCPKACRRPLSDEREKPRKRSPNAPRRGLRKSFAIPPSGAPLDPIPDVPRPSRKTPSRPVLFPAARPVSNDAGRLTLMALGAPGPTMTSKRSMQRVGVFSKHPDVRNLRTDRTGFRLRRPAPSGGVSKRHRTALSCVRAVTNAIGRQTLKRFSRGFVDCRAVPPVRLVVAAGPRRPVADSNLTERRRGPPLACHRAGNAVPKKIYEPFGTR